MKINQNNLYTDLKEIFNKYEQVEDWISNLIMYNEGVMKGFQNKTVTDDGLILYNMIKRNNLKIDEIKNMLCKNSIALDDILYLIEPEKS